MLVRWRALPLWFCLSIPQVLFGAGHEVGKDFFLEGIQQYQKGNPSAARQLFEQAAAAGLSSPSLFYNLGVACYQLGDLNAADYAFRQLLSGPDDALARYNLGLIELARDNPEAARRWFEQSAAADNAPEKLRVLSQTQLSRLAEPQAAPAPAPKPDGRGYLAVSGGYDSNIAGLPDASASSQGGFFTEALAAGSLAFQAGADSWLTLDAAAFARSHPSQDNYDSRVLQGRFGWSEKLDTGELGARFALAQSWFDGERFERRVGLEGFRDWDFCSVIGAIDRCGLLVSAARVTGGPDFEAYDGQVYRLRLDALRYLGQWRIEGDYQLEVNRRRDMQNTNGFVSVSPTRHGFEMVALYAVNQRINVGGLGSFRHSRYADPHRIPESGGESGTRRDNRFEAGVVMERSLDARWLVRAEWRILENESSLAQYDYQRQTLMVTVEGSL